LKAVSNSHEFDAPIDEMERRTTESLLTTRRLDISAAVLVTGCLFVRNPEGEERYWAGAASYLDELSG
jgi:hypothetical protein